jgi:threonine/homoserine/homoserine lactone efflux protein
MTDAIGQIVAFAVVVAISPIPIIGVVLMLSTPRARVNGPAFLLGWVAGLTVAGAAVLLIAGGAGVDEPGAADGTSTLKLVLGIVCVFLAARQWRGRPRAGEAPEMPRWMDAVDHFTAGRAVALGVALSAINPKNLLLIVAAATAIAQTGAAAGDEIAALLVFVAIAALGPAIPVGVYVGMGARAKPILDDLKAWMSANNSVIMAAILLVIGAKLIGDGVGGF